MKSKLMYGLAALLLAFGLVTGLSAFNKKDSIYWQYNQNSAVDIRDGYSYSQITNPQEEACNPGTDLPCIIEVDASINTQALLDNYLSNTGNFPSDSDITDAAMFKKASD